jgi:hypothetical protein
MKSMRILFAMYLVLGLGGIAQSWTFRPATLKANPVIGGTYDPAGVTPRITYPAFLNSPGESLDFSYYDFQSNGSVSRMIAIDRVGNGGLHVVYTKSPNSTHTPRNAAYQYNDRAGSGWSGELDLNTARAGYVTINALSDGRLVAAFNQTGSGGTQSVVVVGTTPALLDTGPIWPHVAAGPTDVIHVVAHHATRAENYYCRSTNQGASFTPWVPVGGDTMQNPVSADVIISRTSGKCAIAWTRFVPGGLHRQLDMDVVYIESTDHGATWGPMVNVTNYQTADTVRAYNDVSGVYDQSDNLHLVWSGHRQEGGNIYTAGAIFHWSQATGIRLVSGPGTISGTWWWSVPANPGTWSLCATRPSLSRDTTGRLFCVFSSQRNADDSSAGGFINMDLYGTGSADMGNTWSTVFNITNSHTPGAAAGACDDDRFPSLTAFTTDSVRMLWIVDRDAGNSLKAEGATTLNPIHYLTLAIPPPGVEESKIPSPAMPGSFELGSSHPNPAKGMSEFTYALPVPREVDLSVYNIQGQLVKRLVSGYKTPGYHTAQWDASGIPAGVYLYRLSAGEFTKTRTMVIVR